MSSTYKLSMKSMDCCVKLFQGWRAPTLMSFFMDCSLRVHRARVADQVTNDKAMQSESSPKPVKSTC